MGDTIKPEIMDHVLRTSNWAMASEASGLVLDREEMFEQIQLPASPSLIVPVDVQALYIPADGSAGENFARLPLHLSSDDANQKATEPFSSAKRRAGGVHLHWALPDGLLRGEMSDDNKNPYQLRPLPNRWLVLRLTGRSAVRQLDVRGWVVESEAGHAFPLEGYPENKTSASAKTKRIASADLTAFAGGSPNWTSSYDAAINRFAFHDDLSDLDANAVLTGLASYIVIGWWSEKSADPIAGAISTISVSRKLEKLRWSASPAPIISNYNHTGAVYTPEVKTAAKSSRGFTDAPAKREAIDLRSELQMSVSQNSLLKGYRNFTYDSLLLNTPRKPLDTVMHGVVYGVPIRGKKIPQDSAPNAKKIELAFAPTLETMMASFASKGMNFTSDKDREYVESLVTAIANSSIRNIGSPDGIIALDEAEHVDGFESFQGPETYEDIIVEGRPEDLRGGRKPRSAKASAASANMPKAELMWHNGARGKTHYSAEAMRTSVSSMVSQNSASRRKSFRAPEGEVRRISRAGPRYHRAVAPVIGLRNYGRSTRFNGDGIYTDDGTLACRWASELGISIGETIKASDYLPALTNQSLPEATNRIIASSFLYDPYISEWTFQSIAETVPSDVVIPAQNRLRGELALRYSADGRYDGTASVLRTKSAMPTMMTAQASQLLFEHSLIAGVEPSPISITSWSQPWSPIWLEWELEITPGKNLDEFDLDMIDFKGDPALLGAKTKISGRAPITSGLARTYESTISAYLIAEAQRDEVEAGEISSAHADTLAELAEYLSHPDMGSITLGGLDNFWLGLDNGPDGELVETPKALSQALRDAGLPRLLRAGSLRLTKARVIDSFGRVRNLSVNKTVHPAAHQMNGSGGTTSLRQPPRLALPARLMWRLTDAADPEASAAEATLNQQDPSLTINPVAGFVLPDFIDEALEFFNAAGQPLGQVMHDNVSGGLMWEGGVGREGAAATLPTERLEPGELPCGLIAEGMITADTAQRADPAIAEGESPLSAFLRAVDTTGWSVEGNLDLSGASIASLVGRPIAVVTARLKLDVPIDLGEIGAYGEEADTIKAHLLAEAVHDKLKSIGFPIRLGEISKAHDGLYGYFINNDYSRFNLVEQSVSSSSRIAHYGEGFRSLYGLVGDRVGADFLPIPSPIECPYIATPDTLPLHHGQIVRLTLLMHPYARIHATSGILPRKSLELLRDWVAPGLSRIAPSARIGPVIIDPDKIRLPKIAAYGARQSWVHRDTPLTWRDDPILSATQAALLPDGPTSIQEGYIRIAPHDDTKGGE